jgi:hypothetical protein
MSKRLVFTILLSGIVSVTSGIVSAGPLVGYWPFDGNLNDLAGTASGTFVGGQATYQKGQIGQAVAFDGVDDYVNIPSPENPAVYTISAWVKPARTSAAGVITRTDASGPTTSWSHQLRINTAGQFHHYLWVGAERHVAGTTVIVPDTWYHVVISAQNNGPMRIYVNGQEEGTSISTAGTLWATGTRITVGSNSGHAMGWFQGLVDDLRIYNRELSAAQIKAMFEGTPPGFVKAEKPNPADGALAVNMPLFQWSPGDNALFHSVYLGTNPNLTDADLKAARQPMTLYYHVPGLVPGATYYWRVDETEKDGVTVHAGDLWTFVAQDLKAYHPTPADGANDAAPAPALTWLPGQTATKHHLYFGDNSDAVTQGAAGTDKGELTDPNFTPGTIDSLTTYYWRVDELVVGGPVRTGPVWKFTTCLPVDDFESYNDDLAAQTTIFDTWVDGLTDGLSNSVVGNDPAPFAERTIIHGGVQSMPMDYNNVQSPFYSEAAREFAPAQDWTANGADTLILYVRGRAGSAAAPLYVAVEDSTKRMGVVAYADPAITGSTKWTQWKIPLSSFAGVNMAKVKKLYIGVGDRKNPVADGAGRIYIDDIRVTKP